MERKGQIDMAKTVRRTYGRSTYGREQQVKQNAYVYGNVVSMPESVPAYVPEGRPEQKRRKRAVKRAKKAMWANFTYGIFLAVSVVFVVTACVGYLQLRSEVMKRSDNIAAMQTELADITERNDTAYQAAEDSVNLEVIRSRAVNELGMVHSSQGRVVEYQKIGGSTVIQYDSIPVDGVLAKSGTTSSK